MSSRRAACEAGPALVRPLLSAGRRVTVDGHAICCHCGAAVELAGPERWRHAAPGRAPARVRPATLRRWNMIAEDDWREAERRLAAYRAGLDAAARRILAPGDNPYLELFGILGGRDDAWRLTSGLALALELGERRRELASLFSWAVPTAPALEALARHAPLVECGAGMGYWSALLRARGIDALAYDAAPPGEGSANAFHRHGRRPWTTVSRATAVAAARRHPGRSLLLCWPPYDDDAASYAALRAYRGGTLIHVGEPGEGATGSVRFRRELALNWTLEEEVDLPHWPRLRDRVMVYRRNPRRRAHLERDRCFECRRFIATGAIGRCDACYERRPPALALRSGRHRVEYPQDVVDAMPPALRRAFEASPNRIR